MSSQDLEQRARALLPELPPMAMTITGDDPDAGHWYRADQMRGYAIRAIVAALRQQPAHVVDDAMRKDAERYRWLRNPTGDVGLVIDKVTGEVPYHEGTHTGGYATYEYRAGDELDSAIDAALARAQGVQS